jgi:hypothetical protein
VAELGAHRGGDDALLVPSRGSQFVIVVDPRAMGSAPREDECAVESRCAFQIAHEIGHTFFFDISRPPRRRVRYTRGEEEYCDRFAVALVRGL